MKKIILGVGAAALLLVASNASAQVKRQAHTESGDSAYEFKDDLLNSDLSAPRGGVIIVRPNAARATLLRPRVNFIPELLKSVENL